MNIHFDNVNIDSRTGPNSFASRLIKSLKDLNHRIVKTYQESDVSCIFIESHTNIPDNHPTVQRLDGIWFKPSEFISKNSRIKKNYEKSTKVIWQSNFDRDMIVHHWGIKPGEVIHNGIDLSQKVLHNEAIKNLRSQYDLIFVSSANWHPQKRLKKNIELFEIIKSKSSKKCALIVMGGNPDHIVNDKDVYYTGSIPHNMCLEIFSAADWMIHLAWLDHCPNTVVEALSQNCPVICTNSGGTSEIVTKNGIVISESTPYNFELADYDNPYEISLNAFEASWIEDKVKVNNNHLDIRIIAQKYEKVFLDAIGNTN